MHILLTFLMLSYIQIVHNTCISLLKIFLRNPIHPSLGLPLRISQKPPQPTRTLCYTLSCLHQSSKIFLLILRIKTPNKNSLIILIMRNKPPPNYNILTKFCEKYGQNMSDKYYTDPNVVPRTCEITCDQRFYLKSYTTLVCGKSMHARVCMCMYACMLHRLVCKRNSLMCAHRNDDRHGYAMQNLLSGTTSKLDQNY